MDKLSTGEGKIYQWHETAKIEEAGGLVSFVKKYEPGSYEIKNELSWLLSTMVRACDNFSVPNIKEASVEQGVIKMEFIENSQGKPLEEVINFLVQSAAELHSLIKSDKPKLRDPIGATEYGQFLKKYTEKRVDALAGTEYELPPEIAQWILQRLEQLKSKFFTIVHRDLRARHLLFPTDLAKTKPVLIDWEFSNISEPAQDLAKLIYDVTTLGMDFKAAKLKIIEPYSYITKISQEELEGKVNAFLPLIPLERDMSLIKRKPDGYEKEILRDLYFLKALYEEQEK